MIKASVSALKNGLSSYLRKVRAGQSVIIYDRDIPIARIERIEASGSDAERIARLRAEGITRPPANPLTLRQWTSLVPVVPANARLLEALLDERAADR